MFQGYSFGVVSWPPTMALTTESKYIYIITYMKRPLKIDKTKLMTNGNLMNVKSIAELLAFCNTFISTCIKR